MNFEEEIQIEIYTNENYESIYEIYMDCDIQCLKFKKSFIWFIETILL